MKLPCGCHVSEAHTPTGYDITNSCPVAFGLTVLHDRLQQEWTQDLCEFHLEAGLEHVKANILLQSAPMPLQPPILLTIATLFGFSREYARWYWDIQEVINVD